MPKYESFHIIHTFSFQNLGNFKTHFTEQILHFMKFWHSCELFFYCFRCLEFVDLSLEEKNGVIHSDGRCEMSSVKNDFRK